MKKIKTQTRSKLDMRKIEENLGIHSLANVSEDVRKKIPKVIISEADLQTLKSMLMSHRPVEIEIGCGKAKFLIDQAVKKQGSYFVGIDIVNKWMKVGQKRANKKNLTNIHFIKTDAREILLKHLPADSVDSFHVNFPDPWPKKRHARRRILSEAMLLLLFNRLKPGGVLYIATDDKKYFQQIKETLMIMESLFDMKESVNQRLTDDGSVMTNYEEKFSACGKPLHYLALTKR